MTLTILLLIGVFAAAVVLRKITEIKLCAICSAVSVTWALLFAEYWLRGETDPLLIGILMGGSAVGGMYYLAARVPESYQILKFPLLLTFFWVVFRTLAGFDESVVQEVVLVGAVWVGFAAILVLYQNDQVRAIGARLIECCRNW